MTQAQVKSHRCFGRNGEQVPGDALDCGECRTALEVSVTDRTTVAEVDPVGETSGEVCALDHFTSYDVVPDENRPGGAWTASCVCGWYAYGRYVRDTGEQAALRLAGLKASLHDEEPDRNCEYCGHPYRLARCNFCRDRMENGRG